VFNNIRFSYITYLGGLSMQHFKIFELCSTPAYAAFLDWILRCKKVKVETTSKNLDELM
jgi:hypothetical protein